MWNGLPIVLKKSIVTNLLKGVLKHFFLMDILIQVERNI